jgi:hypothetical protein
MFRVYCKIEEVTVEYGFQISFSVTAIEITFLSTSCQAQSGCVTKFTLLP